MDQAERRGSGARNADGFLCTNRCKDRKSTRLNSSHSQISYAVFCLKKKTSQFPVFAPQADGTVKSTSELGAITTVTILLMRQHYRPVVAESDPSETSAARPMPSM